MTMVGSGSGQFDRIRSRPKGSDPSGSGSATLNSGKLSYTIEEKNNNE